MGLYDLMVGEAKKRGVKLLLLQIPREVMEQQAVDKGDIQFFELAFLEVEIKGGARASSPAAPPAISRQRAADEDVRAPKKRAVTVVLKDFVIPNTDLVPEEVEGFASPSATISASVRRLRRWPTSWRLWRIGIARI